MYMGMVAADRERLGRRCASSCKPHAVHSLRGAVNRPILADSELFIS
jgi:hypothetical protein